MEKNNINKKDKRNREIQKAAENKKAKEIERKIQENERRKAEGDKLTQNFYSGILKQACPINNNSNIIMSKNKSPWVFLTQEQIKARRLRQPSKKNSILEKRDRKMENKNSSPNIFGKPENNNISAKKGRKINNINNKNGGSKQKNKLNSIKTKYLLQYCKKNKLKGYSEYNKKDLINFIKNNVIKKLT